MGLYCISAIISTLESVAIKKFSAIQTIRPKTAVTCHRIGTINSGGGLDKWVTGTLLSVLEVGARAPLEKNSGQRGHNHGLYSAQ